MLKAMGDGNISSGSPSTTESTLSPASSSSSMSLVPTLIWVDDKMENNKFEVTIAASLEIRVIQLPSTAVAKLWIEQNESKSNLMISPSVLIGKWQLNYGYSRTNVLFNTSPTTHDGKLSGSVTEPSGESCHSTCRREKLSFATSAVVI